MSLGAAIFEVPLGYASAAPVSLNGETSNSPKLITKPTIKLIFEITNEIWQQLYHIFFILLK